MSAQEFPWPYTGKCSHKSQQKPAALGAALGLPLGVSSGLSSIPELKDAEGGAPVTQGDHLGASVSEHKDRRNVYNIETTAFGIFRQTHP